MKKVNYYKYFSKELKRLNKWVLFVQSKIKIRNICKASKYLMMDKMWNKTVNTLNEKANKSNPINRNIKRICELINEIPG